MTRDDMIAKLCIRPEGLFISGKLPTLFVTVGGSVDDYADDELAMLVAFTEARQADYHRRNGRAKFDWRDNFICFSRNELGLKGSWARKRHSWTDGYMHAPSLPEAMAAFWGDRYENEQVGEFCLLESGDIVEIVRHVPYAETSRAHDFEARSLLTGETFGINRLSKDVVVSAASIEALGDAMRMAMRHRLERASEGSAADVAAATSAVTASNDPAALAAMWRSRLLHWREREAIARAA